VRTVLASAALLLAGCGQSGASAAQAGERDGVEPLPFHEQITGGAAPTDELPLIVTLHGRGSDPARFTRFFEDHDLLLCPAAIVPPFDVDLRYVGEVDGHRFDNYVHWIAITFAITLTGCPAAAVPAGFTASGLPVGLQIVGPPRAEARVLASAAALEAITGIAARLPIDPRDGAGRTLTR